MSASRGNKTGREKASKNNHVQNGKTEPIQIGTKNQASQSVFPQVSFIYDGHRYNDTCTVQFTGYRFY